MKIFAKRKKKAGTSNAAAVGGPKDRDRYASDPIVTELLKKDPSEWNSKERRMVKRYEQRKEPESDKKESSCTAQATVESGAVLEAAPKTPEQLNGGTNTEVRVDPSIDNGSTSSSSESSDDDSKSESSPEGDSDPISSKEATKSETDESSTLAVESVKMIATESASKKDTESQNGKVDPDHKIWKLLEQLNSKTKRTLTRKAGQGWDIGA